MKFIGYYKVTKNKPGQYIGTIIKRFKEIKDGEVKMQVSKYILVKDKNNKVVAYLMPNDGLKNAFVDCRINGESTLEFLMPIENEKWKEITPECKFYVYDREYIILKDDAIDIVRDGQKILGKVMAVESWKELEAKFAEPFIDNSNMYSSELSVTIVSGGSDLSGGRHQVGTAAHALYALLQGTGWTLGTVDVTGIHDLETEKISILENIKQVQKNWGGLIIWDSINKKVSLRDEVAWKNYTGFQIRYAKNLKHITRTQSNRIITKLYPFGEDDLDIASENDGKKYIQNNSYTDKIYVGIYRNQDIYDPVALKNKAISELALLCQPRYNYKVGMVDLRTLPEYSHEDFSIGDMVEIIDIKAGANKERVRLLRHKFDIFQPWKCELEVGDPENRFIESLKASFDTAGYVDEILNSRGYLTGQKLTDGSVADIKISNVSADKITAGTINATIEINSPIINGGTITIGSGNNVFKASSKGIHAGHKNFDDAPFSVDMEGYARFSDIDIVGGSIDVSTDVRVGNNIYLGNQASNNIKHVYFNSGANISNYKDWSGNPPSGIQLSASTFLVDGDSFDVDALNTHFSRNVYFEGNVYGVDTTTYWDNIISNPFEDSKPSDFVSTSTGIQAKSSSKRCYIDLSDDGFLVIRDRYGDDVGHVYIE